MGVSLIGATPATNPLDGWDTIGLLGRLDVRSKPVKRIGKEVDRLSGDEGAALDERPIEYERIRLDSDIFYLNQFPKAMTRRGKPPARKQWSGY
jgi:hypothetical protein